MKEKHIRGLRCPACGHIWNGHSMVNAVSEYCPVCVEGVDDPQLDRVPAGRPYEGSVEVEGCDTHGLALPCPFCR